MKKIILIFLLVSGMNAVHAQHFFNSSFNLHMFNQSVFAVRFDHLLFPEPQYSFNLENIKPGRHYVEVIKYRKKKYSVDRVPVVISARWINIPANSKVSAKVTSDYQIHLVDISGNCYVNVPACDPIISGSTYMNETAFGHLKEMIRNASFESSRMTIARQAISRHTMLSIQVRSLMEEFWFESSRLEFAKYAYNHTYDQENYYLVNGSFKFESSIKQLYDFIYHS